MISNTPKVSCYCATFGRPHLLEESIESFLRQDYGGEKELIVLNDCTDQELNCEHPNVLIENSEHRIVPLGRKFNETIKLCTGDILLPWEDDDIFLPWRISYSLAHMRDEFFHTYQALYENTPGNLTPARGLFQCNMAISAERMRKVKGYAEKDIAAIDFHLFMKLGGPSMTQVIPKDDIFYIYRWETTNSYHGSGWGSTVTSISEKAAAFIDALKAKGDLPTGKIKLQPKWSRNWVELARHSL